MQTRASPHHWVSIFPKAGVVVLSPGPKNGQLFVTRPLKMHFQRRVKCYST